MICFSSDIEAADVVFMTSSLSAIPEALEIAKITNQIAVQNIVFALTMKALVMILGLFGSIIPIVISTYGYLAFYNHFDGYHNIEKVAELIELINNLL